MSLFKPDRPNTVRGFLSLARLDRHVQGAVADVTRIESVRIALGVQAPSPHPGLTAGKGTLAHLVGGGQVTDEAWEEHLAPVLELCRPRGKRCRCGNSGTIRIAGVPGTDRFCEDCKPRGVFGVIDGGDGAA